MSLEANNNLHNINSALNAELPLENTVQPEAAATHEAKETGEHEHTLFAEPIFHVGNFPITNSLLSSWLAVFLIIILAVSIRIKNSRVPSVFQGFVETVIEGALGMMDLVTNDRKKSEQVFPLVFSIFIFILFNNWLGLLPGIGSITYNHLPLLRGGTADLNTTLALGLFSVIAANVFGVIIIICHYCEAVRLI